MEDGTGGGVSNFPAGTIFMILTDLP